MLRKYIVVIDDDEISMFITRSVIASYDLTLEVNCFTNAKDGIKFINDQVKLGLIPELIIIDINMPIIDGWATVKTLEETNGTELNICILTSSVHPSDKEKAKVVKSIKSFLHKPLNKIELIENINLLD